MDGSAVELRETDPYLIRKRFEYQVRDGQRFLVSHTHLGGSGLYQHAEHHRLFGAPVHRVVATDTISAEEFARRTAHCHWTPAEAFAAATAHEN